MATKHVMFYSNFCQYSTEVIRLLVKKDMRSRFVMVCVDENRHQIPKFVDRVPVILTSDRRVLMDEAVIEFIEGSAQPPTEPMAAGGGCVGSSAGVAFVDGTLEDPMDDGSYGFVAVNPNTEEFPRIYAPDNDDDSGAGKSGRGGGGGMGGGVGPAFGSSMDRLIASRESELQAWRPNSGDGPPPIRA